MKNIKISIGYACALALVLAVGTVFGFATLGHDDNHDLDVHNKTGHEVVVFLFQDDHVHMNEEGGVQFAHLHDGESAVAHVPNCTFSVLLVDHEDVWHAEFHDCHSTDMTFTSTTGHAKKEHPHQ